MSEQIINLMNVRGALGAGGIYGARGPEALVWTDQAGQLRVEVTDKGLEAKLHATLALLCLPVARVVRLEPVTIYGQSYSETTVGISYRAPGPALVEAGWTLALRYPQHGVAGLDQRGRISPDDDPATPAIAA